MRSRRGALAARICALSSRRTGAARSTSRACPNALQGFSQNRDQPVQIEAASLEVRDKERIATFSGNVKVVQGDTDMRCKSLVVFYDAGASAGRHEGRRRRAPAAQQQISRLEAKGGVTVTQKEQTATGDSGMFDMRANTVTLMGNVVVSQGPTCSAASGWWSI